MAEPDKPQMAIWYGACALRARLLRLQSHTLRICNTYCFYTATMVMGTRLNVMFVRTLPVLLLLVILTLRFWT